jgi:hypothetical protein
MSQTRRISKNNTQITDNSVTLYSTKVVSWTPKTVTLNSGGYQTATTKTRMNQASNELGLGFYVYRIKGVWFVDTPQGRGIEFVDGMTFTR